MNHTKSNMNPFISKSFKKLKKKNSLEEHPLININNLLSLDISHTFISKEHLRTFQDIANEANIFKKYDNILNNVIMNPSEHRAVSHHHCRAQVENIYTKEQQYVNEFAINIQTKKIKTYTKKKFKNIIQFGIGGSHLGPEALLHACKNYLVKTNSIYMLNPIFITNIDPLEFLEKTQEIALDETLFIIVSKSGSTEETISNLRLLKHFWVNQGNPLSQLKSHCVSITTKHSIIDNPSDFCRTFYIDDTIGGRFSATSIVGGLIISCCCGNEIMERLLYGAYQVDQNSKCNKVTNNLAALAAMISVYHRNFLDYRSVAIIPYSHALARFPAHIQQVSCESNGKQVNIDGEPLTQPSAPVIFGEAGTNAQHSFFQMLHQGTDIIPVEFIGFTENITLNSETILASQKLKANLKAQAIALAVGEKNSCKNKNFPGNRPSTSLLAPTLCPETIGAILAFYENKIMFEGFLWNLNSFDQEGVQLGKRLAKKFLNEDMTTK